jgi:hypothetical protein
MGLLGLRATPRRITVANETIEQRAGFARLHVLKVSECLSVLQALLSKWIHSLETCQGRPAGLICFNTGGSVLERFHVTLSEFIQGAKASFQLMCLKTRTVSQVTSRKV